MLNEKYNPLIKKWTLIINPYLILVAITILSLAPENNLQIDEKFIIPNLDKIVHIAMYFGLSFSILFHFFFKTTEKEKLMIGTFLFSSCYGAVMEFLQCLTNLGRNANFFDFLANEVGGILAILTFKLLLKSKSKIFHFD